MAIMSEENEIIEFELSKELKEKLKGMMFERESSILVANIKSEKKPIRSNVDKSSMKIELFGLP